MSWEAIKPWLFPPGPTNGIFAPAPEGREVRPSQILETYRGWFRGPVLRTAERHGWIQPGAAERALSGAAPTAIYAAAGEAAAAHGWPSSAVKQATQQAVALTPNANPIYQSPLLQGLGPEYASAVAGDGAAGLAAAEQVASTGVAATEVAGASSGVAAIADAAPAVAETAATATAATGVSSADQALMAQFERLSQVPFNERPAVVAAALDTRAAAGHGTSAFETLATALAQGAPSEQSASALESALGHYAQTIAAAAPEAATVSHLAAAAAPQLGRAFTVLSPTMAAFAGHVGPIPASALRGVSAFARPAEQLCTSGLAELLTHIRL
ncbi:MAG: hypothetical protein JWN41_406 [Thermoleophilia bacterium]|nr:hypothetical protein [Thermoleophilia bacterium]